MLCVRCGKPSEEAFCEDCFLEKNGLFEAENFPLHMCKQCGSYYSGKTKYQRIEDAVAERIVRKGDIRDVKIEIKPNRKILIKCSGYIKPARKIKHESKFIEIKVIRQKCLECSRLSGNYHEAVVQIRNSDALRNLNIPQYAVVQAVRDGYNIKFMSKKDAEKVAKGLGRKYDVTRSFKLVGEKKGKKLYRNYYAVR